MKQATATGDPARADAVPQLRRTAGCRGAAPGGTDRGDAPVDETLLSLPWELMPGPDGSWRDDVPLGRIVTTGIVPARGRDPKDEDPLVRLLVIANPTGDLDAAEVESDAIVGLAGTHGDVKVEVTRLSAATGDAVGVAGRGQGSGLRRDPRRRSRRVLRGRSRARAR